jgi:hypothetical protein
MHPLSATELLDFWDQAFDESPTRRALTLLVAASPESSIEELAALSVGRRDARLLQLREWTFGRLLQSYCQCSNCGERLELTFNMEDIKSTREAELAGELSLTTSEYKVRFRLPDSSDLAALCSNETLADATAHLINRCVLGVKRIGDKQPAEKLPVDLLDVLAEAMERADPQGNVELAGQCASCGNRWTAPFDIESFFWNEINAWAIRILREVDSLARAYGWSEAEVLGLSPWRRQCYLEMIGG